MQINLKPEFGYVLLAIAIHGFQCILTGFLVAGRARNKTFTEQFMKQNFGAEHKKHFEDDIKSGGYPDTGSGVYSRALAYPDWYNFNNAQRVHMNFVEMFAPVAVFLAIGGVYYPIPAAAIGLVMIIARIIYTCGYSVGGPGQRFVGAIANNLSTLAAFILSIISAIRFILAEQI